MIKDFLILSWPRNRSTAHFRTALSTRFSSQSLNEENGFGTEPEVDDIEREFVCPIPDCFKAYKHSSGLRYHIKHVSANRVCDSPHIDQRSVLLGTPSESTCAIIRSSSNSRSPISDEDKADAPKSPFRGVAITQLGVTNALIVWLCLWL